MIASGCSDFDVVFSIDDYEAYLAEQSTGDEFQFFPEEVPEIAGFKQIFPCGFDYATEWSGQQVVFRYHDRTCIGLLSGKAIIADDAILEHKIYFDRYLKKENGKVGLYDLFGNEILPCAYDWIRYNASVILAERDYTLFSFTADGTLKAQLHDNFTEISLLTHSYILLDSRVYDAELQKETVGGYDVLFVGADGQALIVDGQLIGYGLIGGDVLLFPQFQTANLFVNGTAIVSEDDHFAIINEKGDTLYQVPPDIKVYDSYDGLRCFESDGQLGMMNEKFEVILEPIFDQIAGYRVYGDYLVDSYGNDRFYDLNTHNYVSGEYRKIIPVNGYFVCQNIDETYRLLDENLKLLIDGCTSINFNGRILRVEKDEKFYFYTRNGEV